MTLKQIRTALRSEDVADRNRAILELLKVDTVREAYRVALTILPDLTLDTWGDWVKTAQEGTL